MTDSADYPYATYLDVKFAPLSVVDVPALIAQCKDRWYNQTLCKVNDSVIRLGVMQGEYHWHKHDHDRVTSSSTWRTGQSICSRWRDSSCPGAWCTARGRPSAR